MTIAELLAPSSTVRIVTTQATSGECQLLELNEQGLLVRQNREGALGHVLRFYPWTHILYVEELTEERVDAFNKGVEEDVKTAETPAAASSAAG
jgi:hypothetical protein